MPVPSGHAGHSARCRTEATSPACSDLTACRGIWICEQPSAAGSRQASAQQLGAAAAPAHLVGPGARCACQARCLRDGAVQQREGVPPSGDVQRVRPAQQGAHISLMCVVGGGLSELLSTLPAGWHCPAAHRSPFQQPRTAHSVCAAGACIARACAGPSQSDLAGVGLRSPKPRSSPTPLLGALGRALLRPQHAR